MEQKENALRYLKLMEGKRLRWGHISPGGGTYKLCFGKKLKTVTICNKKLPVYLYNLHIWCDFQISLRTKPGVYKTYTEHTDPAEFHADIKKLYGRRVRRVELGPSNSLLIDLKRYWIVCVPDLDSVEAWIYYVAEAGEPHLIANDNQLNMSD